MMSDGDYFRKHPENMSIEFMECVAKVRFGMCVAADMFYQYYCGETEKREKLPRATREKLECLRKAVQKVIANGVLLGTRNFLIKQLSRQYGYPYLTSLSHIEWLNVKFEVICGFYSL